jgi:hypothetical protein
MAVQASRRLFSGGGQVTVTDTTQLVTWTSPVRDWMLYNNGNKTVYVNIGGTTADADATSYYPLEPGETIGSSMWPSSTIWLTRVALVCDTGESTTVKFLGLGGY